MTWAQWRTGLATLFAELGGVPCDWRGSPRGVHPSARLQIDVIGLPSVGVPERRHRQASGDATQRIEAVISHGRLILQVDAWSPRQSLEHSARALIHRVRSRLYFASTLATLRGLYLALEAPSAPLQLDPVEDGRDVSRWTMDVSLGFAWEESDEDNPGTWIDSVHVTPTFRDPAGDEIAGPWTETQVIP